MAKYSFSKSKVVDGNGTVETFQASDFASFDEAKRAVDKAWYDYDLEVANKKKAAASKDVIPPGFGAGHVQGPGMAGGPATTPPPVSGSAPAASLNNNVGNNQH